jgi:hypothetical protein|tara:strand:+ start:445 stop:561 length:117 start_codon:yes stop_codon:yes gene_type:complete
MRILIIAAATFLICASCGVKNDPEYQSQNIYNDTLKII